MLWWDGWLGWAAKGWAGLCCLVRILSIEIQEVKCQYGQHQLARSRSRKAARCTVWILPHLLYLTAVGILPGQHTPPHLLTKQNQDIKTTSKRTQNFSACKEQSYDTFYSELRNSGKVFNSLLNSSIGYRIWSNKYHIRFDSRSWGYLGESLVFTGKCELISMFCEATCNMCQCVLL